MSQYLFLFAIFLIFAYEPTDAESSFYGDVAVVWLQHDGDDRLVQLIEPFKFVDQAGVEWEVPIGAKVDGASIPRLLWAWGAPFVGDYRRASVVYDYYCDVKTRPSRAVNKMFYEALLASNVSAGVARLMFAAVRAGGPDWSIQTAKGFPPTTVVIDLEPVIKSQATFKVLKDRIESQDLDIDSIEELITRVRAGQDTLE